VITETVVGPDKMQSTVEIAEDATVRDVTTSQYHLFWRTTKKNGIGVIAFTTKVVDGDKVTIEKGVIETLRGPYDAR
jgi:hypothetical protein